MTIDPERLKTWLFALTLLAVWIGAGVILSALEIVPRAASFLLWSYPASLAMGAFVGASYFGHRTLGILHAGFGLFIVLYSVFLVTGVVGAVGAAAFAGLGARGGYVLLREDERTRVQAQHGDRR